MKGMEQMFQRNPEPEQSGSFEHQVIIENAAEPEKKKLDLYLAAMREHDAGFELTKATFPTIQERMKYAQLMMQLKKLPDDSYTYFAEEMSKYLLFPTLEDNLHEKIQNRRQEDKPRNVLMEKIARRLDPMNSSFTESQRTEAGEINDFVNTNRLRGARMENWLVFYDDVFKKDPELHFSKETEELADSLRPAFKFIGSFIADEKERSGHEYDYMDHEQKVEVTKTMAKFVASYIQDYIDSKSSKGGVSS